MGLVISKRTKMEAQLLWTWVPHRHVLRTDGLDAELVTVKCD
jgi:hypothetical protein